MWIYILRRFNEYYCLLRKNGEGIFIVKYKKCDFFFFDLCIIIVVYNLFENVYNKNKNIYFIMMSLNDDVF